MRLFVLFEKDFICSGVETEERAERLSVCRVLSESEVERLSSVAHKKFLVGV